jgi:hypothetical protein
MTLLASTITSTRRRACNTTRIDPSCCAAIKPRPTSYWVRLSIAGQILKENFVWNLPGINSGDALFRTLGFVVNDWQLSGVWTGLTGAAYDATYSYTSGAPM